MADKSKSWDDLTRIEEEKLNEEKSLLEVLDVKEFGILNDSLSPFSEGWIQGEATENSKERFLIELRSQLNRTDNKDVIVFVHGTMSILKIPFL
jgi:hypothetical protein